MKALYLIVLLVSLVFPLGYTIFKLDLIKKWKAFSISTSIVALLFLVWDVFFTQANIWGFNKDYCLGISILELPFEEILFFLIIPFCSLFIHFAIFHVYPDLKLGRRASNVLTLSLVFFSLILMALNFGKAYTAVNFYVLACSLLLGLLCRPNVLRQFYISFIPILIPFGIVNGALTGLFTASPIVWYDNAQNLGIRITTIPVEDIAYAFSMLLLNLVLFDMLTTKKTIIRD
ncbi:MAG: lycopene cyclase domain-containing protein [Flavobacteriales bacterium]|jgi:lycopene cyclase domain-containing protein